jgi:hypothetical protein
MSHSVKLDAKFKIDQKDSLRRAFENLGWSLKENSTARTYSYDEAKSTKYPLVAVNPQSNGYDLGLQFNDKTGEIEVIGDFYGGSVAASLGQNLDRLKQENQACVFEDHFAYFGYSTTRNVLENGEIEMLAEQ